MCPREADNCQWLKMLGIASLALGLNACYSASDEDKPVIDLPRPETDGPLSVEQALNSRRSIRSYSSKHLRLEDASQLLWSAQGITGQAGFRSAPSAGATFPLEVYLVSGSVEEIEPGIYRYKPNGHTLTLVKEGNFLSQLASAALGQQWVRQAPANIIITAFYERTTGRYGDRGIRYVHMEAGHAGQNVYLQAESLNIGTVVIGAFSDGMVRDLLELPSGETPLYILPVGYKS